MAEENPLVPIKLTRAQKPKSGHIATESYDYNAWAAHFVQQEISTNEKKYGKGYWRLQEPAAPTDVPKHHETIEEKGTPEQKLAYAALAEGLNVCILGPGGTGKSQFIQWARSIFLEQGASVVVTASTSNAAYLLGGITLHRFSGLPVYVCNEIKYNIIDAFRAYMAHAWRLNTVVNNIMNTSLWICDEISMLPPRVFILVDLAFRYFRGVPEKPFGGCYFLWSGDFLQIPPVQPAVRAGQKRVSAENLFLFSHDAWYSSWQPSIIPFTTNKRSREQDWSALLARVRMGKPTYRDIALLRSRTVSSLSVRGESYPFFGEIVTHIFPTNEDVKRENDLARARLPGSDHQYPVSYTMSCNVAGDWTELDELYYRQWCSRSGPIPNRWYPNVGEQTPLAPCNPWYKVLARSIFLETGYVADKRHVATDDECNEALQKATLKYLAELRMPTHQVFRLGEKVRLTVNIAYTRGLVNGMTGKIVGFCAAPLEDSFNWPASNVRYLKHFMNGAFESWASEEEDPMIEEQDQWGKVLECTSAPRTADWLLANYSSNKITWEPVEVYGDVVPFLGKVRAHFYGNTVLEEIDDLRPGDLVWSDEVDFCWGIPIVEWSTGVKTLLPKYDWMQEYTELMASPPEDPRTKKKAKKDRWQIHVYAFPIKPAHAMTYHDCQGQTCYRVMLGNVSRLFCDNMLYVGLSRAPALESVAISDDFAEHHIKQHKEALEFFKLLGAVPEDPPAEDQVAMAAYPLTEIKKVHQASPEVQAKRKRMLGKILG